MNPKDKVRRLTMPQMQALKGFILNSPMSSQASGERMNLSGKELGGIHSSLLRNGFIEPIGRNEDRSLNFKVTDQVKKEKNDILKLIDSIETIYKNS